MSNFNTVIQSNSFKTGWGKVQHKDTEAVRQEIMDALHISKPIFYTRLNGKTAPKDTERTAIEAVFNKYGVTEIWGE